MNISHKHKVVWWMPERTASKMTSQLLKRYDFYSFLNKITHKGKQVESTPYVIGVPYHSHSIEIDERYKDYTLISNIRNPYDRIFGVFVNFSINPLILRKNSKDIIKDNFKKWIDTKLFSYKLTQKVPNHHNIDRSLHPEITNWKFESKVPDYVVRVENFLEDMVKLEFITNGLPWKNGEFSNYYHNNNFKTNRSFDFNEMYDYDTAKKVFFYYKNHFYLYGYDPFSFTSEKLSKTDQLRFIHEPL
jgi:hypothetical protein